MAGLAIGLAACDLGPDYRRPAADIPPQFRASQQSAQAAWPPESWWTGFASPELDDLINAAKAYNYDLVAAAARVQQADAQVRIATSALFPSLSAGPSASWQHAGILTSSTRSRGSLGSNASFDTRSYGIGLDAAYTADFWGQYASQRGAAVASAVASRFDQQTVALTVLTDVAAAWFTALALADRLTVAQENLKAFENTLTAIRARFAAGTNSALDVAQEETLVAQVRAVIPNLKNQLEQQVIGLGILTGRPPESITVRPVTLTALKSPPVYPGVPSTVLLRRPDVSAAEARLLSANYNIKSARAAFFPTISLTGSAGYQAAALNQLLTPGGALIQLAASLTQPLFDGGALRGQLELTRAQYLALEATYRQSILQAFTDVDNALTAVRFSTEQEILQQRAVDSARRSAAIARAQMTVGTIDVTTVLQIETALFNSEDTLTQVRLARFLALLSLYKALGGGWERPSGTIEDQFPGLTPDAFRGGIAMPIGDNIK